MKVILHKNPGNRAASCWIGPARNRGRAGGKEPTNETPLETRTRSLERRRKGPRIS